MPGQSADTVGKVMPLRVGAGLLAAALLIVSSLVSLRAWRGERLLARGGDLLAEEPERGEELLLQALRHGNGDAAIELAKLAYSRLDWPVFHRYADAALQSNPYQGYVHTLKAFAMAAEQMPGGLAEADGILAECRRAVEVEPASAGIWQSCAELSLRLYGHLFPPGAEAEGAAAFRAEVLATYRAALALSGREAGQFVAAMADIVPDGLFMVQGLEGATLPAARETVGILVDRGLWQRLSAAYWQSAESASDRRGLYRAAVEALRQRKRHLEVVAALERYAFTAKDDAPLAYLAALSAEALGPDGEAWPAAETFYRRALLLDGGNGDYRRRLGIHLVHKKSFAAAAPLLVQSAEEDPRDHQSRYYLGVIAEARGDGEASMRYFREALSLQPENRSYRKAVEIGGE